jgi:hypothetical protein
MKPKRRAILTELPPGFLDDLPEEDQKAILEIVGKPIEFVGYDEDGRAELEFTDGNEVFHSIFIGRKFVRRVK